MLVFPGAERRNARAKMRVSLKFLGLLAFLSLPLAHPSPLDAQDTSQNACPRPQTGSVIREPRDLRSQNGVLQVELTIHSYVEPGGSTRYCYLTPEGDEAPNLRVNPGDLVVLKLKNQMTDSSSSPPAGATTSQGSPQHTHAAAAAKSDPCTSGAMTATSTNLHFHGLTIPPVCHQDEVMQTSIGPDDSPFEYRFRIPEDEPPGLYWYHPHIHGFTKRQVLGGASGALIVEGIERANKTVAGLPERVLIVRDQDLINPNAPPSKFEPVLPKMMIDRDGDAMNTGTGFGKPAKDLSLNFVPGLSACDNRDETGRAAALARLERFGDYLPESRGALQSRAAGTEPRGDGRRASQCQRRNR
jgi:FtsP/CotA-like multicopper oxidase with cupredoxin domain